MPDERHKVSVLHEVVDLRKTELLIVYQVTGCLIGRNDVPLFRHEVADVQPWNIGLLDEDVAVRVLTDFPNQTTALRCKHRIVVGLLFLGSTCTAPTAPHGTMFTLIRHSCHVTPPSFCSGYETIFSSRLRTSPTIFMAFSESWDRLLLRSHTAFRISLRASSAL